MNAVAPAENTSVERYVPIFLRDRRSDQAIFQADYCQMEEEEWRAVAKDVVRGTLQFLVIAWANEASG
jgi:hypothetical protein